MRSHASPVGEGFRALFGAPGAFLAEVTWRWSFAAAALVIAVWSANRFLHAIVVSTADEAALATAFPTMVVNAARHIVGQMPPVLFRLAAVLLPGIALLWVFASAAGKLVSTQRLIEYFADRYELEAPGTSVRFASILMLQFLRVVIGIAAVAGYFGCLIIALMIARSGDTPSVGRFLLAFLPLEFLVMMIASWLNWIISLAPIFCVRDGRDWLAALDDALLLSRRRAPGFSSAAVWFGIFRFVFASSFVIAALVALGLADDAPRWAVTIALAALCLAWVVISDALLTARLATYVAIAQQEIVPASVPPSQPTQMEPPSWLRPLPPALPPGEAPA